jgi:NodT family efflux transporter outer membrane factor (OMF) lipoprotein
MWRRDQVMMDRGAREFMMRAVNAAVPLAVVGLVLSSIGCTVGPEYGRPQTDVPDMWHTRATAGLDTGTASLQTWWQLFDDPQLDSLVARAAAGNLSLREALWRVEEARAQRGVAGSARKPQVVGDGQSSRSQPSDNGPLGDFAPQGGFDAADLHDYGVSAFWEIDVFGRIRRQVEAAEATTEATVEAYRDVLVSLYAEVALAYIDIRTQQERLQLARTNVEGQENTLQLTQDRFDAGLVSALDVAQAESNLANTRSLIPVIERELERGLNRLAVLLGDAPGAVHEQLAAESSIPREPGDVAVGLPAELLRQRPDVRQAERLLAAQTARIGVATADLYPTFSLAGFLGLQATDFGDLTDSGSVTWGFSLPIRWDIFSGGRIRSQIRIEEARTGQLLASYERTVLLALEEAENAMVAYGTELERRQRLAEAVDATQRSLELVLTQYTAGLTDFQNVLDTQRTLLTREDELARSEGITVANLVRLYRTLGGGWNPDLDQPPTVASDEDRVASMGPTG